MSILKFEPNTPITVTLRYPKGKHVPNKFNPDEEQVMYSFTDGSVAYFPPIVENKIEALTPAKGQPITICKSQKNGTTEWQVSSIQKPQLVTKLLDNSDLDEYPEQPPRKPVSTQLANALKTALQAAKEAEEYSEEIGHPVRFDKDDVRLMAQTLVINASKERAA